MRPLLITFLIVPGVCGCIFCFYFALRDWRALQSAYAHYQFVATHSTDFNAIFVAEANQNIHRINIFADVVWALMAAILAAIGLHGLCVVNSKK